MVFLVIALWHGAGWNFVALGDVQALGVVATHYYTVGLKELLGREGFRAYNSNRWIHGMAMILTFCYVAASLLFLAHPFSEI